MSTHLVGAVLACVVTVLQQGAATDPFLSRIEGRWAGEGVVLEQPSRVEITWEWTLDRRFLRLRFVNQMGPSRRFEGHAYYRALGDGRYRGVWVDNTGAIRPIDARLDGEALVARWGTAETEIGETTYRLMPDGTMAITDRVQGKDGAWRDFGRVVVARKD